MIKTIDELSPGDFIKVSQTDGPVTERLNFSGEIIRVTLTTGRFEVKSMLGTIGVGFNMDDMDIEIHRLKQKPNGWDKFIKSEGKSKPKVKPKAKTIESKKVRVLNLVKDNPRKGLPGLLKLAVSEIGGDETVLESYISIAISKVR